MTVQNPPNIQFPQNPSTCNISSNIKITVDYSVLGSKLNGVNFPGESS